jgi:hypothetical protein
LKPRTTCHGLKSQRLFAMILLHLLLLVAVASHAQVLRSGEEAFVEVDPNFVTSTASSGPAPDHYPLRGRCVWLDSDEACPVVPVGAVDRWLATPERLIISIHLGCGYTVPDAAGTHFVVEDLTVDEPGKPYKRPIGVNLPPAPTGQSSEGRHLLTSTILVMGAPEPGTSILNVTLVDGASGRAVDSMLICLEVTLPPEQFGVPPTTPVGGTRDPRAPVGGRAFEPDLRSTFSEPPSRRGAPRGAGGSGSGDVVPINMVVLGDTGRFDGMKRFIYTNLVYTPKWAVNMTYVGPANAGAAGRVWLGGSVCVCVDERAVAGRPGGGGGGCVWWGRELVVGGGARGGC